MKMPRIAAKVYADLNGFFWLPCPVCGEMFGGHEWQGSVECAHDPSRGHGTCCVPKGERVKNPEVCARAHDRIGDRLKDRP